MVTLNQQLKPQFFATQVKMMKADTNSIRKKQIDTDYVEATGLQSYPSKLVFDAPKTAKHVVDRMA